METGPLPDHWQVEKLVHGIADITTVNDGLAALMAEAGFPDKDLFAMRLAVEEAIVNAMRHGHANDPTKPVRVRYQLASNRVWAEIEDQGPGFDPKKVPDPLAPENLERPSGRGIFLIRYYMTWVKFNDRGNCLTLCKERTMGVA